MELTVAGTLLVRQPGQHRADLEAAATFRRRGRLPADVGAEALRAQGLDPRRVEFFRRHPDGTLELPRGLLRQVLACRPERVADRRASLPPVDWGFRRRLYPEQYRAVAQAVAAAGGLIVAPPGAGKSVMAVACLAEWRQPALWICASERLWAQAAETAAACCTLPAGAIGLVGQQERYRPGTHLTVALAQTLWRYPAALADLAARCGAVVVDEAHHAAGRVLAELLCALPAGRRLGLTGTPERTDGLWGMVEALFGPDRAEVSIAELVSAGRLIVPQVVLVPTAFRCRPGASWPEVQAARARDMPRNGQVVGIAAGEFRAGRRVLILAEYVLHAQILAALLRRAGLPAAAVVGETPRAERDAVQAAAERHEVAMVATRLADEGLDMPPLDCGVLAASGRAAGRTKQQEGRLMRVFAGKRDAVLYDLCDVQVPSLYQQARERVVTYTEYGARIRAAA